MRKKGILLLAILVLSVFVLFVYKQNQNMDIAPGSHGPVIKDNEPFSFDASSYFNGNGTEENPYQISDKEDLKQLSILVSQGKHFNETHFILTKDIDLENEQFEPIGNFEKNESFPLYPFMGIFDGNHKTISNLYINSVGIDSDKYASGLFGAVTKATIKNLNVDTAHVEGHHFVSAVVGTVFYYYDGINYYPSLIENCTVRNAYLSNTYRTKEASGDKTGTVVGDLQFNTLVLEDGRSNIINCHAYDSYIIAARDSGQIVGYADEVNVINCSAENVIVNRNNTGTNKSIRHSVIGRYALGQHFIGDVDTSWYDDHAIYQLSDAKQLAGLSYLLTQGVTFENKTIELTDDIDFEYLLWDPVHLSDISFQGTFKSNGHSIKNLYINADAIEVSRYPELIFGNQQQIHIQNVLFLNSSI